MYLNKNTVIVTICVAVIRFPGLFLEMEQNFMEQKANTAQRMKFPIKVFSVNEITSTVSCGFGHIHKRKF